MKHDIITKARAAGVAPPDIQEYESAGKPVCSYTWESIAHAYESLTKVPAVWPSFYGSARRGEGYSNSSWCEGVDWKGALKYLAIGWQDGAKPIIELSQSIPARQRDSGEKYGQTGRKVDLGRYLAGDPNCMKRKVRASEMGRGKAIRIAVNVAVNGYVSAKYIQNYGAALVAVVDELEQAGFRTEISVHSIFKIRADYGGRECKFVTGYMVKRAGEQLDFGQVAFCIGHVASERKIQFGLAELLPREYFQDSYGGAADLYLSDLPDLPAHALIMNGWRTAETHSKTLEDAVAHVREEIGAALGGDYLDRLGWNEEEAA